MYAGEGTILRPPASGYLCQFAGVENEGVFCGYLREWHANLRWRYISRRRVKVGLPHFWILRRDKVFFDLEGVSSYAFYCTGKGIEEFSLNPGPSRLKKSGNIWQSLFVLSVICLMFFLVLVLSINAWVRKYGGTWEARRTCSGMYTAYVL